MVRRRLVFALLMACLAGPVRAEIIDRVLAMVGSQVITASDVRAAEAFSLVPPSAKVRAPTDTLVQLVNRQLMLTEVERYSAPDPERPLLDRRVGEIRAAFKSPSEYEQALARSAMSEERLRSLVADNIRIEAYVDQRFAAAAQPTPDEVQRYYREHPSEFTKSGQPATFDEVQEAVLQKASAERKRALITDWLDRLRRRGEIDRPAATGIR
jgi:hypothetical protein